MSGQVTQPQTPSECKTRDILTLGYVFGDLTRSCSASRSRVPILISWVLILGLAGLIVYGNLRSGESPSTQKLINDERARMFGMVAVQMKSLQKEAAGTSSLVQERMGGLIQQLESDARTAEDRIRIAILEGESFGADEALMRLSNIP